LDFVSLVAIESVIVIILEVCHTWYQSG